VVTCCFRQEVEVEKWLIRTSAWRQVAPVEEEVGERRTAAETLCEDWEVVQTEAEQCGWRMEEGERRDEGRGVDAGNRFSLDAVRWVSKIRPVV
jgi:hypothetical protein